MSKASNGHNAPMRNIVVSAGILFSEGRLLVAQRPYGKPFAGYWEFPGGKCGENETPRQALCRELAEELGIEVRECSLFATVEHEYQKQHLHLRIHFFRVDAFDGEPCPRECQMLRWAKLSEVTSMDFLPADADVLTRLLQERA